MLAWASSIGAYNSHDSSITHVITSGGGYLSIPDEKHDEFQKQYATASTDTGSSVTLSELPSDGAFPMVFKITPTNNDGLTRDGMLDICSIVIGVLSRYYPDHPVGSALFESVAYPGSSEELQIDGSTWIKRGFGLVFRKLFVTKEEALQLRYTLVCELRGQLSILGCPDFTWSDAIPREVHITGIDMHGRERSVSCTKCVPVEPVSGAERGALKDLENEFISLRRKLRPMSSAFDYGSLVNVHTIELKSQEFSQIYLKLMKLRGGKTCTQCAGRGTYLEKTESPLPTIALDDSGRESAPATELLEVIRQTSIRARSTQESTPGFSRPANLAICPPADTADLLRVNGDLRMKRGMTASLLSEATSSDLHTDDLKGLLQWKKDHDEVTDPEILRSVQEFIRTRMGLIADEKHYANLWVTSVYAVMSEKKVRMQRGKKLMERIRESNNCEAAEPTKMYRMEKLWIRVKGEGSCFCGNRGLHECNSIYF
ncbi:unnamed protein product, partial [Pylaiella littoralis]